MLTSDKHLEFRKRITFNEKWTTKLDQKFQLLEQLKETFAANRALIESNSRKAFDWYERPANQSENYFDTQKWIVKQHTEPIRQFAISEDWLKTLHKRLFKESIEKRPSGKYKQVDKEYIQYLRVPGTSKVISRTLGVTPAGKVKEEMKYLISWANKILRDESIHPIVATASIAAEFLYIHPFHNGNGRTSKILIFLLLTLAGYEYLSFKDFDTWCYTNKELSAYILVEAKASGSLKNWFWFLCAFIDNQYRTFEVMPDPINIKQFNHPHIHSINQNI